MKKFEITPEMEEELKAMGAGSDESESESQPIKRRPLMLAAAFKARKRDSSHGIGLAMVKRTAEIHGGQVGIVCRDGKNTFYFSVPLDK